MRQVLIRAVHLPTRPAVLVAVVVVAGLGTSLVFLPLFGLPGYELGLLLSIAIGVFGGGVGIAAANLERRMIQGRDPRPPNALRFDSPTRSALVAMGAASTLNVSMLLPPFIGSLVYALASSRCDPFAQLPFFPVLVIPSALMASAAGVFAGFATPRALFAVLAYALLVVASLAVTAWPIVFGPQVFAFNHFLGYVPGPLYDEALTVTPALLWFRLQTVLAAGFLAVFAAFCLDMREGRILRPHFRPGAVLLLSLLGAGIVALEQRAPHLGTRMTHGFVAEKLGATRETEHFVVHYGRGKPKDEVERLVRDLEFRHAQLVAFFGQAPEGKIRVYVYRSPDEKRRLVGASRTQFAKPWRLELHINDAPFPHPVLKHELAHVMAAPFGSGPFRVTSSFKVWPNVGVIEGMAVAGDDPVDELTLHEWSAGMKRQGLLPDVRKMLSPQGFYAAPPARAYTAAGSFLRYLADTYGPEKLRALYARGDFARAYGRNLSDLAAEWEKFLEAIPLDQAAVNVAFARFRRPALFARPCAREVASLAEEAADLVESDPDRAVELYARCAQLQPDEPAFRLGQARALVRADRKGEAVQVLSSLVEQTKEHPALAAEVHLALADVWYAREQPEEARQYLQHVLGLEVSQAVRRTAQVKLFGLDSLHAGKALWSYFRSGGDDVKLLVLREALTLDPKNPYVNYLIGRRLSEVAPKLAEGYLVAALEGNLPEPLKKEALRLKVVAAYLAGDCNGVRSALGQAPDYGAAFKAQTGEYLDRCAFEEKVFKGALVPDWPFR